MTSVARDCETLRTGAHPTTQHETLTDEQLRWERVTLGLRTADGPALEDVEVTPQAAASIEQFVRQGLLRRAADRLRPTAHGMLVADALARGLLFGAAASAA